MSFIALTNHAKERALSRYGIGEGNLLELAEKAVMYGVGYNDKRISAKTKKYIKSKIRQDKSSAFVYGSYLFIFVDKGDVMLLITCLPVPTIAQFKIDEIKDA